MSLTRQPGDMEGLVDDLWETLRAQETLPVPSLEDAQYLHLISKDQRYALEGCRIPLDAQRRNGSAAKSHILLEDPTFPDDETALLGWTFFAAPEPLLYIPLTTLAAPFGWLQIPVADQQEADAILKHYFPLLCEWSGHYVLNYLFERFDLEHIKSFEQEEDLVEAFAREVRYWLLPNRVSIQNGEERPKMLDCRGFRRATTDPLTLNLLDGNYQLDFHLAVLTPIEEFGALKSQNTYALRKRLIGQQLEGFFSLIHQIWVKRYAVVISDTVGELLQLSQVMATVPEKLDRIAHYIRFSLDDSARVYVNAFFEEDNHWVVFYKGEKVITTNTKSVIGFHLINRLLSTPGERYTTSELLRYKEEEKWGGYRKKIRKVTATEIADAKQEIDRVKQTYRDSFDYLEKVNYHILLCSKVKDYAEMTNQKTPLIYAKKDLDKALEEYKGNHMLTGDVDAFFSLDANGIIRASTSGSPGRDRSKDLMKKNFQNALEFIPNGELKQYLIDYIKISNSGAYTYIGHLKWDTAPLEKSVA